jgi:IS5 family transposase
MGITVAGEAFLALIKPVDQKPSSKRGRPPIPLDVWRAKSAQQHLVDEN